MNKTFVTLFLTIALIALITQAAHFESHGGFFNKTLNTKRVCTPCDFHGTRSCWRTCYTVDHDVNSDEFLKQKQHRWATFDEDEEQTALAPKRRGGCMPCGARICPMICIPYPEAYHTLDEDMYNLNQFDQITTFPSNPTMFLDEEEGWFDYKIPSIIMDEEEGWFDYKIPSIIMDEEEGWFDYNIPSIIMDEETMVELQGNVVDFARSKVGSPYQYGGSSFKTGIDCSSFVGQTFKQAGIELPRTSSQIAKVGVPVTGGQQNWKPGDILNYPGHVGIYAGNNKIIHAAGTKKGVVEGTVWGTPTVRRILH